MKTRWFLAGFENLIKWARMEFSAKKSHGVVLKRGKPSGRYKFKVAGEAMLDVKDQPIKCLGNSLREH